jgi:uncharacterized Fe-S center protein
MDRTETGGITKWNNGNEILMQDAAKNLCGRTKHKEIRKNYINNFNSIVMDCACKFFCFPGVTTLFHGIFTVP